MAIVVQKEAGGLAALVAGNSFYSTVAVTKICPTNNAFETIAAVGSATYINFTPTAAQDFLGVILLIHNNQGDGSTDRGRVITVELEEDSGGWTSRLTQTIDTDDFVPDNTWSRTWSLVDVRFASTYTLTAAAATWRLKIYHDGTGSGSWFLCRSENAGDDNIFHIVYTDNAVSLTASDVLVLTDKITMDDDLTLEKVDTDSGTQNGMSSRSRYYSIYACSPNTTLGTVPQIYVPSAAAADYTLTMKGIFFLSSYGVGLLVGEDADNPLPLATRTFTIYWNDTSSANQSGFKASALTTGYGKMAGVEIYGETPSITAAVLAEDALASQAEVVVEGDVTGDWSNNDYIMMGGAQFTSSQMYRDYGYNEYVQIQSMSYSAGNDETTITLTGNLTYNYYYESADMPTYISYCERNILIYGVDGTWTQEVYTDIRGGYMICQGVEFQDIYHNIVGSNYLTHRSTAQLTNSKTSFDGCHFHDCGYPFDLQSDQMSSEIKNCTASSTTSGTTSTDYLVRLTGCRNVTIDSNIFSTSRAYAGVYINGGYGCTITDNYFNVQYPLFIISRASGNTINSNKFFRSRVGILFSGTGNTVGNGNLYRKIHYNGNYGATSETTHGAICFANPNGEVYLEDEDIDDCFAAVVGQSNGGINLTLKNANLGSTWIDDVVNEAGATYRPAWLPNTEVKFEDYDEDSGDCRCWFTNGYIHSTGTGLDDTESRTDGAGEKAWRFERYFEAESLDLELTTPIGEANEPITITVYCRIDAAAYSAGVSVAPSLTISGLGMTGAGLTDSADEDITGEYQLLSVSGTPTDVGQITITLSMETDASGSDSYVYWDDMYVSYKTPVDLGTMDHVFHGLPISPPMATQMTGQNVWAELLADNIISGSMGETMNRLGNIAAVGSAINTPAGSYTLTTGTQSSGTVASTIPLDGTHHEHTDDGGTTDLYYEFDVGGDGIPTDVIFTGRINGQNDDIDVYGYDWGDTAWVKIGTLEGTGISADSSYNMTMFSTMVGTGSDLGTVRVRFYSTGLSTSTLRIDQIYISYAVVARSVGYSGGMIWVDTNASNTNTESYVDGTADNPVSTWAAALTLNAALGLNSFHVAAGSSITLSADSSYYRIEGDGDWSLALGGQAIAYAYFSGALVTGTGTGVSAIFYHCLLDHGGGDDFTVANEAHFDGCGIAGILTLDTTGTYHFHDCYSHCDAGVTPTVDFNSNGNQMFNFRPYFGPLTIKNMGAAGTDQLCIEGHAKLTLDSTCDPSNSPVINIVGHVELIDNVSGGFVAGGGTINDDSRYDMVGTDNAALAASFTFDGDGNVHAVGMAVGVLKSGHFPNL